MDMDNNGGADLRFDEFFNEMPMAAALIDDDNKCVRVNPAGLTLLSLTGREDEARRSIFAVPEYQPDGRLSSEKAMEHMRMARSSGRLTFEWTIRASDGEDIPSEITLLCLKNGGYYSAAAFIHDLREIKNATDALNRIGNLAFKDSLTGLYNRRYFMDRLNFEFHVFDTVDKPISIIMYDLDRFKLVNDAYGHQTGDEVLRQLSERVRYTLRTSDLLARYGGEEFIVLALGSSLSMAENLAWRLQQAVAEKPFICCGHTIPITISLGVATKTRPSTTQDELIRSADEALYLAKNNGRNRAEVYLGDL